MVEPNSTRKVTIMKELNQLKARFDSLSKEKEVYMYKRNPSFYAEFVEMEKKTRTDFHSEKMKTKKEIQRLKTMIQRFHQELKSVKPTPEFLVKLKEIMEGIEKNLMEFKDTQRSVYEELTLAEAQHSHEIAALDSKIDTWSEPGYEPVTSKPITRLPTARDVIKDLPPEVAQFEKFVQQNGGSRGGWDEYDHATFLRWRVRLKGRPGFVQEAISRLPTKTGSEVKAHEEWYKEFLRLQDIKREAITAWKNKKKESKGEVEELMESSDEEEKQREEQKRRIIERERLERQQRLGSWKLQKELERAEKEEIRLKEEREKEEREEEERVKKEEMRRQVALYKEKKRSEDEFVAQQRILQAELEEDETRQHLQMNKERIELRNQIAIDQKVRVNKEKEEKRKKQQEKDAKLKAQYSVNVRRDPSRLLKPTAGWTSRTSEVGASSEAGRVYHMTHRAVPGWREGL